MRTLSVFQQLPLHIAKVIAAYYVDGASASKLFRFVNKATQTKVWFVLHDISYSWRSLALEHFFREVTLEISSSAGIKPFAFEHFPHQGESCVGLYHYVKNVNIIFDNTTTQPTEKQQQLFSIAWPESVVFSSARSLAVIIRDDSSQKHAEDISIECESFSWVAQRISTALPKLQEAYIEYEMSDDIVDCQFAHSRGQAANSLFLAIFEKINSLKVRESPVFLVPNDLYFANNPGLTSFSYTFTKNIESLHFIVKMSALTLENLSVFSFPMKSFESFIFSDDGKPIVYPNLKGLYFQSDMISCAVSKVRVAKSIAPFPVLRHINWDADYAFEDDTLFRGNSETLEYLSIRLDAGFSNIVQNENMFSVDNYPNIRYIKDSYIFENSCEPAIYDSFVRFKARLVSSSTQVFRTNIPYSYTNIMHILSTGSHARNIVVLSLACTTLTLLEIIDIVRILPNVADFMCDFEGIDSGLGDFQVKTITDQLHTKHYPLSSCLKHLSTICDGDVPSAHLATLFTAFAILCPSLISTRAYGKDFESLQCEIRDIITSGLFDKHAQKLEGIISIE